MPVLQNFNLVLNNLTTLEPNAENNVKH